MYYYDKLGGHKIIDASTIMCAIGRVHGRGLWYINDRSGSLAHINVYYCTRDRLVSAVFESY
jgi:hypothetical protein